MARRKRKEEEPPWSPPEFDDVEYMRKEIASAKTSVVVIGWSVVGALVSYGVLIAGVHWALAFLLGLFAFAGLRYVFPVLGIRRSAYTRKDWVGHGGIYFLSWLAFWILLLNAPFGDFTNPSFGDILVGSLSSSSPPTAAGAVDCLPVVGDSVRVPLGTNDTVYVVFRLTDNVRVGGATARVSTSAGATFDVTPVPVAGQTGLCDLGPNPYEAGSYELRFDAGAASWRITLTGVDGVGHTATMTFDVLASP